MRAAAVPQGLLRSSRGIRRGQTGPATFPYDTVSEQKVFGRHVREVGVFQGHPVRTARLDDQVIADRLNMVVHEIGEAGDIRDTGQVDPIALRRVEIADGVLAAVVAKNEQIRIPAASENVVARIPVQTVPAAVSM